VEAWRNHLNGMRILSGDPKSHRPEFRGLDKLLKYVYVLVDPPVCRVNDREAVQGGIGAT